VAVGYEALRDTTTGTKNTAVGGYALDANTTGDQNCALGYGALGYNTTADNNISIGYASLGSSTTGCCNAAIGSSALYANTTGAYNVAVGHNTLSGCTTGTGNVAIGKETGQTITTGANNICIGHNAEVASGQAIGIAIGANVTGDTDYEVTIGNDSVGKIQCPFNSNATWTRTSDIRFKKDIKTNTDCGLGFINDLRTTTYKWKAPSERPPELNGYNAEETEPAYKEKMYGFIAQEIKEALDKHGITDFNGWSESKSDGSQKVSYEMFVIPLVKAVQELSAKIEALEAK